MSSLILLFAAGVVVLFLVASLLKRFAFDRIQTFIDRRRGTSNLVSRGDFVEGSRHIAVALALTESAFYYENTDMQASLDRKWIQEVEYDNELATGQSLHGGTVLRLRCFSQTFEFVLPVEVVRQWQLALPQHRMSETPAIVAVS